MGLAQRGLHLGLHGPVAASKLLILPLCHLIELDLALQFPLTIVNFLLQLE